MNRDGSPMTRTVQPPQRLASSSGTSASSGASVAGGGGGGGRQDAASILMMSLNIWHKGGQAGDHLHQQYGILSGRKKTRSTKSKAVSE